MLKPRKGLVSLAVISVVAISSMAIQSYALNGKNPTNNAQTEKTSIEQQKVETYALAGGDKVGLPPKHDPNASKPVTYKTSDEIKSNIDFKVEKPTKNLEGLTQTDELMFGRTSEQDSNTVIAKNLRTIYKGDKGEYLELCQRKDDGSYKPEDVLSQAKKIAVNGVEAWALVPEGNDPIIQLMYWKDGKYYNLMANKISVDRLIQIAESIK